jgi:hypothetical protein
MGQSQSVDVAPNKTFSSTNDEKKNDNNNNHKSDEDQPLYPTPTEYDEIDKIQAELPSMIDEESRQQVDE